MESKNSIVVIGIAALLIGLGGGYLFANNKSESSSAAEHGATSMMANLESKTGEAFERAFTDEMIAHHQSAIDMARLIPERTSRPELIKLGKDIISAQSAEIQMMKQWNTQWFGETDVQVTSSDSAEPGSAVHNVQ